MHPFQAEAEALGWQVWTYMLPQKLLYQHQRYVHENVAGAACVLRNDLGIPFTEGKPVPYINGLAKLPASQQILIVANARYTYYVTYRVSEDDAWADLPATLDELRRFSGKR